MPSGPRSSARRAPIAADLGPLGIARVVRSEEHTSELQSLRHLVCRLLLEKKKTFIRYCRQPANESPRFHHNRRSSQPLSSLLSTSLRISPHPPRSCCASQLSQPHPLVSQP